MDQTLISSTQRASSNKKYYVMAAIGLVATVACVGVMLGGSKGLPPTVETLNKQTPPYVHDMFHDWKAKHGKSYESEEEHQKRLYIFHDNLKFIQEHYAGEPKTYDLGINEYSDLTWEEFKGPRMNRLFFEPKQKEAELEYLKQPEFEVDTNVELPAYVNWVEDYMVTPVKNQLSCGSCWSFSAVAALEGAYVEAGGELTSFSEQQFVDCDNVDNACHGGIMDNAFRFAEDNPIETYTDYPYTGEEGQTCKQSRLKGKFTVTQITDVQRFSEVALQTALSQHVVSVAIEADQRNFQFYTGGVYSGTCGHNIDHGVTAVGYGTDNGQDYWLVKNSWGSGWGESGYIRILRNDADEQPYGHCGIATLPSYPTVQKLSVEDYPLGFRKKFDAWKREFNKEYFGENEHEDRLRTFYNNYKMIEEHNASGASYTMAINQFADLTTEEYASLYLSPLDMSQQTREPVYETSKIAVEDLPSSVDWREKGGVNPVQNQGSCGACWAFSAVAALEGAYFVKTGTLDKFSEQQLLDCDSTDLACGGGLMDNAFRYFEDYGPELESDYPYVRYKESSCRAVPSKEVSGAQTTGFYDVPQDDVTAMMQAVAQQPVSVAVEADRPAFQFYSGGVLNDPTCGTGLDHGIVAVGYGEEDGQEYWLVRNSWGPTWGDNGYIKLAKNTGRVGDECGVLLKASYPTLA